MSTLIQNDGIAENVFGEDKKKIINKLRGLVKENSQLTAFQKEDEHLIRFLYWTSFDVNNSIEKMKMFLNLLLKYSSWFAAKPPLELKTLIERNAYCILDSRDKEGRAIIVVKVANMDFNISIEENATVFELVVDYGHMQAETRENGVSIIMDMENLPWKLLTWITPRNIKIIVQLINGYPLTDLKIHVVKTSFIFDAAIKIIWPLLPANIKDMIKFHFNNWESLHEFISPENLPQEYGGTGPDINFDYYIKKLYDQNENIKERLKYRKAIWKNSS